MLSTRTSEGLWLAISGGKGLYGPQGTGLLLGSSKELIDACRLNASPHSAIGRAMKVGRESICALIAALEVFLERDEEADKLEYKRQSDYIVQELEGIPGIKARTEMANPTSRSVVPRVYIQLDPDFPVSAKDVQRQMLEGELPIAVGSISHTGPKDGARRCSTAPGMGTQSRGPQIERSPGHGLASISAQPPIPCLASVETGSQPP